MGGSGVNHAGVFTALVKLSEVCTGTDSSCRDMLALP